MQPRYPYPPQGYPPVSGSIPAPPSGVVTMSAAPTMYAALSVPVPVPPPPMGLGMPIPQHSSVPGYGAAPPRFLMPPHGYNPMMGGPPGMMMGGYPGMMAGPPGMMAGPPGMMMGGHPGMNMGGPHPMMMGNPYPMMGGPPHMMFGGPRPPPPMMGAPQPSMMMGGPPAGWTPSLTTVSSTQNPAAVVPLTVYVGKIPLDTGLNDAVLRRIFEVFGKLLRWNRPTDSSHSIKAFGFATFEHAQCALRCVNVLGNIEVAEDQCLVVQVGTKETAVLESLTKWEAGLNMSDAMKEKEDDMRSKVVSIIANPSLQDTDDAKESYDKVAPSTTNLEPIASIESMDDMDEESLEAFKEKQVFAEIEKFRVRQAVRDKELAEAKKRSLAYRLKQLKDNSARMAVALAAETAKAEAREKDREESEKRVRETAPEEEEANKRRRQEVLDMVSENALDEGLLQRSTVKVGLKLSAPVKSVAKIQTSAAMFAAPMEDEVKPKRSLVPIDYSEDSDKPSDKPVEMSKKDKQKELVDQIPTDRESLFAYSIDWNTVRALQLAETSLRPWIAKKMIEYLGEEEKTLVDFIIAKISNRCDPSDLLGELVPVLDEEAEQFVIKLWRMLIFSLVAAANA